MVLTAAVLLALSLVIHAERLPVRTYTIADGLLRDTTGHMFQDSHGFMWFCTADGVSRFDGYGFINFTTDDGLPERHVNDVVEMPDGTIFLATGGGLARLNPKGIRGSPDNPLFSVFTADDARAFNYLLPDVDNTLLAGTDKGLYRIRIASGAVSLENIRLPQVKDEPPIVTALFRDSAHTLWVGTPRYIVRIREGAQPERFGPESGVPGGGILRFAEDEDHRIWVAMRDFGGLLLVSSSPDSQQNPVLHHFSIKDGLPNDWISDVMTTRDGGIWLSTPNGLCQWQHGEAKTGCERVYKQENGLCAVSDSLLQDKDGNLWVSGACGLNKIAGFGFASFSPADGLGGIVPDAILESRSRELIISARGQSRTLSRFDGEKFELERLKDAVGNKDYGWGWKQTVLHDSHGDWWVANGTQLLRYRATSFSDLSDVRPEEMKMGTKSGPFRVYEDSRGDVWVGTFGETYELLRWERSTGKWHDHTAEAGITKAFLCSGFIEDPHGNLWITTGDDTNRKGLLIRYKDGRFTQFTDADGVPGGWMRDLYLDADGRLWLANTLVGLLRLDDTNSDKLHFVKYGRAEGLASNGIYCVVQDAFGRIYAGSGRGIDRIDLSTGRIENFTTGDGLPGNQVEIAYRDKNNDLWFATSGGLARFRPGPPRPRVPPKAFITGLRTPSGSRPVSIMGESGISDLSLASYETAVALEFIGIGPTPGERLRYEYRLNGGQWIGTGERTLNFADLSSGDFQFEVRSITGDGLASEPAVAAFSIAAPIWRSWWFLLLAVALVGIVIYLVARNRINRAIELERMRMRIATDLHDDIGANLTRIALLSEVANQQPASAESGKLLPSIADIARESVASMNDIVWAVSPDHDRLQDLVRRMRRHAEEVFTLRDIDLRFEAPEHDMDQILSVGIRRDLLLIFKEAVNNAARHSDCTRVSIDFKFARDVMSLSVADNGKGFDTGNGFDGHGLRSMTRRAEAMRGKITVTSGDGNGTCVLVSVPVMRSAGVF
jgi:signal transduction histidine kinase/ligand-binding sensor domain-containing protein